ncbi:Hydroxyphenylpyruvate reductase [Apostasia shenzhenica]|uniref:Hydroxyphenylpyruvate reductase n=1 Tax=Apostasia shenzhenica TaxID=1088818 RepID=A0A2I0B095_9ASPA|nr:Hydroxyphenylpyruvate reductase [Apostasia shenzhenica]
MESLGGLLTLPVNPYLESELDRRPAMQALPALAAAASEPQRLPGSALWSGTRRRGPTPILIDELPRLEIVSFFVDLAKCRARGICVTNTHDVLTDDAADLAVGHSIATLRRIYAAHRYLRSGGRGRPGAIMCSLQRCVIDLLYGNEDRVLGTLDDEGI